MKATTRKMLSLLLAICMIMSMFAGLGTTTALASGEVVSTPPLTYETTVTDDEVAITVSLKDKPEKIRQAYIQLHYESSAFTFKEVVAGSVLSDAGLTARAQSGTNPLKVTFGYQSQPTDEFASDGELGTIYFTIKDGAKGDYNFTTDDGNLNNFNGYYFKDVGGRNPIASATIPVTITDQGGTGGGDDEPEAEVSIVASPATGTPGRTVPVTFTVTSDKIIKDMTIPLAGGDNFYVTNSQLTSASNSYLYHFSGENPRTDHLGFPKFRVIGTASTSFVIGSGTKEITVNLTIPKNATPGIYDIMDATQVSQAIMIQDEENGPFSAGATVSGHLTITEPKEDPIKFEAKTTNNVVALRVFCTDLTEEPNYVRLRISNVEGLAYAAIDSGEVLTAAGLNAAVQDSSASEGFIRVNIGNNTAFTQTGELCTLYFTGANPENKIVLDKAILPTAWTGSVFVNNYWNMEGSTDQIDLGGTVIPIAAGSFSMDTPVTEVTLNKSAMSLSTTGVAEALTATVAPENASRKTVVWISSNPTVASVSNTGLVTPKAAGTATITAKSVDGSGTQATCVVTVIAGVTEVSISGAAMRVMEAGKSDTITAVIAPANAHNKSLIWTSSDESVATVENGIVTAVANGEAIITATTVDGGYMATVKYRIGADTLEDAVAQIGTVQYAYFADAVNAVTGGGATISLLKDAEEAGTIALSRDCSIDLKGYTLTTGGITVPIGVNVGSISNGTLMLTGGSPRLTVKGTVNNIFDCNITGIIYVAQVANVEPRFKGTVELIENCHIIGSIEVHGEVTKISDCIIAGNIMAMGLAAQAGMNNGYSGLIWRIDDCDVTKSGSTSADAALYCERGEMYVYSGNYVGTGSYSARVWAAGTFIIYGGGYKGLRTVPGHGIYENVKIANGYLLEDTPDAEGYYAVVKDNSPRIATFQLIPADATLAVFKSGSQTAETPIEDNNLPAGSFSYAVERGVEYSYSVTKTGFQEKTGLLQIDELPAVTIPVTLIPAGETGQPGLLTAKGGDVITSGGTYELESKTKGTISIMTREPVTLVGKGITNASTQKFSDLTIDCSVSRVSLTIRNLWINNNVGQGTPSGDVNFGSNILNFTGTGNSLSFEGENLLETQEYVQGAGIHVPKGASLTFNGPGTLYMYKYSQGAGIGGNSYEACGNITFAGGQILIKGSKTGPLIGGDSMTSGLKNDSISITDGTLVLINKANGAAIGASKQGTGAGNVYLRGGNLTIISDYLGSAIGYGGDGVSDPGKLHVSGGSFKAMRTGNSMNGNGNSSTFYVNDTLVTAAKFNGNGSKEVSRLIFDTTKLARSSSNFTVSGTSNFTYNGGLHYYYYTESTSYTPDNFGYKSSDKNIYLYLPMENQTLTVNGEEFAVTWDKDKKEFTVTAKGGGTDSSGITEPVAKETIDVEVKMSGTKATATVSGSTVSNAIKAALEAAGKENIAAAVEIKVSAPSTATEINTVIPTASLKAVADSKVKYLMFDTPMGNITLDNDAVTEVAKQAGDSETTITISKVAQSALTEAQKEAVGNGLVVDLTVASGGKTISDLGGGKATVSIPYDLKTGETAAGIAVWYLADDGKLVQVKGAKYSNGVVTFTLEHFSRYLIAYDPTAWVNPFKDVSETSWYYDDVRYVSTKNLFKGTSDTAFSPNMPMTRSMFVTVLGRLAEVKAEEYKDTSFADVKTGQWYSAYVEWAAKNGIVTGVGNQAFNPNGNISREEMAIILYRYAQFKKADVSASKELSGFPDAAKVSAWAVDPMEWAVAKGLINGMSDGTLSPRGTATRAQVAAIIHRFDIL